MKKKILSLITIALLLWCCNSNTNEEVKSQVQSINEIDELVHKYNSSVIHLKYGERDLQGNKYVFYNTDKKPFKIACAGDTKDWELLAVRRQSNLNFWLESVFKFNLKLS